MNDSVKHSSTTGILYYGKKIIIYSLNDRCTYYKYYTHIIHIIGIILSTLPVPVTLNVQFSIHVFIPITILHYCKRKKNTFGILS